MASPGHTIHSPHFRFGALRCVPRHRNTNLTRLQHGGPGCNHHLHPPAKTPYTTSASGCVVDSSVHEVQGESRFGIGGALVCVVRARLAMEVDRRVARII